MNLFSVWYRQGCRSAASQLGGQKLPVIPAGVAAGYHRCFWQPSWQGGGCGAEGVSCSFRSRGRPEVYFVQQLIRSSQLLWFRGGTDGGPFRSEEIRGSRCQNVDSANCGLCSSCCMKLDEYPHTISHFTFHVAFCACRIQKVGRFVRIYFVCALQVWAPDSGERSLLRLRDRRLGFRAAAGRQDVLHRPAGAGQDGGSRGCRVLKFLRLLKYSRLRVAGGGTSQVRLFLWLYFATHKLLE
jgi:hypothetical protein